MFSPNLISNSLIANNGSSSEEVQVKGKLVSGPAGRWESQGGCPAGLGGASVSPRALEPVATGSAPCPSPTLHSRRGACIRVSGAHLHVGLTLRPRGLPAPAPPAPLASVSRTTGWAPDRGPLPPQDPGQHTFPREPCLSGRKLGRHACHVYTFTSQICLLLL